MLGCWLVWTCACSYSCCEFTSVAALPCLENIVSLALFFSSASLSSFYLSSIIDPQILESEGMFEMSHLEWRLQELLFSKCGLVLGLCINQHLYKSKFWFSWRNAMIYSINFKFLRGRLIQCAFNRIIVLNSLLELMIYHVMGSCSGSWNQI